MYGKTCRDNKEEVDITAMLIEEDFGIRLEWHEYWALSLYIRAWKENAPLQEDTFFRIRNFYGEAKAAFMKDYFGLDLGQLRQRPADNGYWAERFPELYVKRSPFEELGSKMIGTPEFKEYCRRHVDEWRDERDLL